MRPQVRTKRNSSPAYQERLFRERPSQPAVQREADQEYVPLQRRKGLTDVHRMSDLLISNAAWSTATNARATGSSLCRWLTNSLGVLPCRESRWRIWDVTAR